MRLLLVLAAALTALPCLAAESAAAPTEQGVRDAENAWSRAFISGDAAALDGLLDPQYVSISAAGAARSKAEVIALGQAYAAKHPGSQATPLAPTSTIRVVGNSAVVVHHNATDISTDVFYYADGRWHALISQHTAIRPPGT